MRHYLWEMRPYFRQVAGQRVALAHWICRDPFVAPVTVQALLAWLMEVGVSSQLDLPHQSRRQVAPTMSQNNEMCNPVRRNEALARAR